MMISGLVIMKQVGNVPAYVGQDRYLTNTLRDLDIGPYWSNFCQVKLFFIDVAQYFHRLHPFNDILIFIDKVLYTQVIAWS